MSIFKKTVYCAMECTLVRVYVHIKKLKSPCCSGDKLVNSCITAMTYSIIRHSRHLSSIEALSAV